MADTQAKQFAAQGAPNPTGGWWAPPVCPEHKHTWRRLPRRNSWLPAFCESCRWSAEWSAEHVDWWRTLPEGLSEEPELRGEIADRVAGLERAVRSLVKARGGHPEGRSYTLLRDDAGAFTVCIEHGCVTVESAKEET